MPSSKEVHSQVQRLTTALIAVGICDEQLFPVLRKSGCISEVGIEGDHDTSTALKNQPYNDIYTQLVKDRNFNFRLADGGLIQIYYKFENEQLQKHRLAYFPAPNFEHFQNEPELYYEEDVFCEVVEKNVVPVAVRFDYDAAAFEELNHPKSHLTLGQFKNCRIPVSSPMSPGVFIEFILRCFYNTVSRRYAENIAFDPLNFTSTITKWERSKPHINILGE